LSIVNRVNKTICLIIFCFLSFAASCQTLRVGFIDFPPHFNFAEKNTKSPLFQYIDKALSPLNFDIEYVRLARERAYIELASGRLDMLMPTSASSAASSGNEDLRTLSSPLYHSVPGLCFKKENFIPILSATHRLDDLTIGVSAGAFLVPALTNSKANLLKIRGGNETGRGIEMTQRGRLDAFYHLSPIKVYHRKNALYKEVACSYFHGYSTPKYIAVAKTVSTAKFTLIKTAFEKAMQQQSYEYYFATRK
jgi:hypothetical protein